MFTILIDLIEHLDNSCMQNYVGKTYMTNEIIQFSEQK